MTFTEQLGEIYQGRFLSAAASRFDDPTSPPVPNYVTHNYLRHGWWSNLFAATRRRWTGFLRRPQSFVLLLLAQRSAKQHADLWRHWRSAGGAGSDRTECASAISASCCDRELRELITLAGGGSVTAPDRNDLRSQRHTDSRKRSSQLSELWTVLAICAVITSMRFPLPNLPGAGRNFVTNRTEGANVDSYDIRIDHRITDSNSIFGRYSKSDTARSRDNFFPLGTSPNGNDLPAGPSAGDEFGDSKGFTIGDTHIFSPTVVNDARFGVHQSGDRNFQHRCQRHRRI